MGWLGDGSHRGQGCQTWKAVGLPPRYPPIPRPRLKQQVSIHWSSNYNHISQSQSLTGKNVKCLSYIVARMYQQFLDKEFGRFWKRGVYVGISYKCSRGEVSKKHWCNTVVLWTLDRPEVAGLLFKDLSRSSYTKGFNGEHTISEHCLLQLQLSLASYKTAYFPKIVIFLVSRSYLTSP